MVGLGRFELPTSRLSGVRSNQLSYRPGRTGRHTGRDTKAASKPLGRLRVVGAGLRAPVFDKVRQENQIRRFASLGILRKEVIQPQVPLRLPCYDFTPVADLTVVGCLRS
jgi:hypothetical protein